MLFGFSSTGAARLVAAICAGLIVGLAWRLARRWAVPTHLAVLIAVLCATAPALSTDARWAWSEPPFIVVLLLIALRLDDTGRRGGSASRRDVIVLAALCGAGVLCRYAGIGLIPGVAVGLVLLDRSRNAREERSPIVRVVIGFLALSAVVPGLLMVRNQLTTHHFGGPQFLPVGTVIDDLLQVAATLGNWFLPGLTLSLQRARAAGVLVALLLAVAAALVVRRRTDERRAFTAVQIILPLVLSMSCWILLSARVTWVVIDARMLSPMLPLLVLLFGVALSRSAQRPFHRLALAGAIAALGIVGVLGVVETVDETTDAMRHGSGYASDVWDGFELIDVTRTIPPSADLYSNLPDAIWSATRRVPVMMSPAARGVSREVMSQQIDSFVDAVCAGETYLAWFDIGFRGELLSPEALGEYVQLSVVRTTDEERSTW